jgi:small subunit ribosomal protein S17
MAKTLIGTVSSVSADKTIVITVHTRKTHPLYKKQYSVTTKYIAHDEKNQCSVGDKVSIEETRPLSARKRHTLKEVISKAKLSREDLDVIEKESKVASKDDEEAKS